MEELVEQILESYIRELINGEGYKILYLESVEHLEFFFGEGVLTRDPSLKKGKIIELFGCIGRLLIQITHFQQTNREGSNNNYFSNLDTIVLPLPYHPLPIGNSMSSFHWEQGQFVVPSFVLFDEQISQILRQMKPNKKKHPPH